MIADQFWLKKQYQKLKRITDPAEQEKKNLLLQEKIAKSIQRKENRINHLPQITYPALPISLEKDRIIRAIQENQVVIIAGETGSGKTTQLPKICLEAGCGRAGMIGHTQPRRIAARVVAARIASELQSELGEIVGYKVRFSDRTSHDSYIKIMTDGILLTETQNDKWLQQYDCIIIDEAHERSLNIDFLLGYLKNLLAKRNDLKVIVTSATIDIERFSTFFNDAPIIEVEGRTYPVEVNYLGNDFSSESEDPILQAMDAVELACRKGPGDILIFQSGEKEIREMIDVLSTSQLKNISVLPLYARQSVSEQQKIFQSARGRKIIVSTNVAETSITVPNIRYVIDPGFARISRYNYRNKLQRLPIEPISKASADQRKGRCGRVGPGICYRLYSEEDFQTRTTFTEPEILRTNLAGVILRMLSLGLKNIEIFPFIDPPDTRYIKDGFTLLQRLEAVDDNFKITSIGLALANIPIEPKLGRIIIAANHYGALKEILIIVSALSIVDPRERPEGFQTQADEAHAKFSHENSDFLTFLNLWKFVYEHKENLSHSRFRKLCRENFLSFLRVCEWFDVHSQLMEVAHEMKFRMNQVEADFSAIHKCLLTGFIDNIGLKDEKREYVGARNIKFFIHPASNLFKKSPSWLLACEIVHTTKAYARTNAQIETKWIEEVAQHLLKKQCYEPFFEVKSQRVMAWQKATLFGLEIYNKRKTNFDKHSPIEARKIFIEQGLVQRNLATKAPFFQENEQTIKKIEEIEHRIRRQQVLLDNDSIYRFYDEHIPHYICSTSALEKWLKDKDKNFLCFNEDQITYQEIDSTLLAQYPSYLIVKGESFKLEYKFDLGALDDGITLVLSSEALKFLKDEDFSWLVPGFIEEKITFFLKALPKRIRAMLAPLPFHINEAKKTIHAEQGTFTVALAKYIYDHAKIDLKNSIWDDIVLPADLKMHFRIIDKEGNQIAIGDDLKEIYETDKTQYASTGHSIEQKGLTEWNFEDLPAIYKARKNKLDFIYYVALVDNLTSVSIQLFDTENEAKLAHKAGLARMFLFYLIDNTKYFKRNISQALKKTLTNLYSPFGSYDDLLEEILFAEASHLFVTNADMRTKSQFMTQLETYRQQFLSGANLILKLIEQILSAYQTLLFAIEKMEAKSKDFAIALSDIKQQLAALLAPGFVKTTPLVWLKRYPIYLKAIELRMEKLPRQLQQDKQAMSETHIVQKAYLSKLRNIDSASYDSEDPLLSFRWKIEELRISYFAQGLKTIEPVSKVRLLKLLENLG